MKYLVIDTEVNLKNTGPDAVGKFKADPFHPDNHVVWWGSKAGGGKTYTMKSSVSPSLAETNLIVGHNLKFDLLYAYKERRGFHSHIYEAGINIWCTQLAEYLLTGQDHKWASLDELAKKYGGTLKDSRMKEYWEPGMDPEDIPDSEIEPYLIDDIDNTDIVFLAQIVLAHKLGMLPLITSQMEALLATTEMEWNGMEFDKKLAWTKAQDAIYKSGLLKDDLVDAMKMAGFVDPNPSSNGQVSVFLFGGEAKHTVYEPMYDDRGDTLLFKSGTKKGLVRTKKVEHVVEIPVRLVPKAAWKNKDGYAVNNDVLSEIMADLSSMLLGVPYETKEFITGLQEYRALEKDIRTYYVGFGALVWPDGKLHGHFNHATTNTGRLSSSAPNLQNVTTQEKE